jgi:F0F1-type ATP synthase membrane subunit c/vacuolar-type H+-ATPase subunit K
MGHLTFLFLLLPAVGILPTAWVLQERFRSIHRSGYEPVLDRPTRRAQPWTGQMLVLLTLAITPVLFGLLLYMQVTFVVASADSVTDAMAIGFGVAGFGVAAAPSMLYRRGVTWLLRAPQGFGRLMVLGTTLQVNVLFAMVVGFQVLGHLPEPGTALDPTAASTLASLSTLLGLFGILPFVQSLLIEKAPGDTFHRWFLGGLIRSIGLEFLSVMIMVWMFLQLAAV